MTSEQRTVRLRTQGVTDINQYAVRWYWCTINNNRDLTFLTSMYKNKAILDKKHHRLKASSSQKPCKISGYSEGDYWPSKANQSTKLNG